MKCKTCGKDKNEFDSHVKFLEHCRLCKRENSIAESVQSVEPVETTEPEIFSPIEHYIPLSICPKDVYLFQENRLLFLEISGRKQGERFVIDEVKMRR